MRPEHVPMIIRILGDQTRQAKSIGDPPRWDPNPGRSPFGVFDPSRWKWWQRLMYRISGNASRWLPPRIEGL